MTVTTPETIILGGGLAGLSAAYHSNFSVYEAQNIIGGTAGSICKNGYVFDFGIHVLHSKDPFFHNLMQELGVEFVRCERKAWIYSFGAYAAYPFQVNTSHLSFPLRLHCALGYLIRRNKSSPRNYEEWIIQNFGKGFADTFLIPYSEKFWGVSPSDMTHDWTGQQRVPQPKLVHVIKGMFRDQVSNFGPNAIFQYPSKPVAGFKGIAQAIANKVDRIHYNMKASAIDTDKKIIYFNADHKPVAYDCLITTMPLPELIKLFPETPPAIQNSVSQLSHNSIAIVNLGIDRPCINENHWIHYPGKDISFFRISFPSNFCQHLNPAGKSTIQAEISFNGEPVPKRAELLRQVRTDLIKTGILKPEDSISFEDFTFLKYGYVIYDHYRKSAVRKIHEYLNRLDIYPCGRYGDWEYQWVDGAVLSGKKIAEKILLLKGMGKPESVN